MKDEEKRTLQTVQVELTARIELINDCADRALDVARKDGQLVMCDFQYLRLQLDTLKTLAEAAHQAVTIYQSIAEERPDRVYRT